MKEFPKPIQGIVRDGKFVGVFVPAENLPCSVIGTAEDWEKAMLPEGSNPIFMEIEEIGKE